uniref:Uncharacterized protein n=1 Tax=Ditylenchus dipsaci TaxID=166011 RepID=A0A915EH85_9BILA
MLANGVGSLTGMNDLLNCVQMIQLPFALLPIITFTSHHKIMFEFSSSRLFQGCALLVSMIVISINLYFSTDYILSSLGNHWYVWILLTIPSTTYLAFVLYLIFTCLQSMDLIHSDFYEKISWLSRNDSQITVKAPWLGVANNANGTDNHGFNPTGSTPNVYSRPVNNDYGSSAQA